MKYRLLPHVHLALVKNQDGAVDYHYNGVVPTEKGPIIPWLNDQQREQFLRENLVEQIDDSDEPAPAGDSDAAASAVDNCLAALERVNMASDAGAPSCRAALREAGFRWGTGLSLSQSSGAKNNRSLSRTARDEGPCTRR